MALRYDIQRIQEQQQTLTAAYVALHVLAACHQTGMPYIVLIYVTARLDGTCYNSHKSSTAIPQSVSSVNRAESSSTSSIRGEVGLATGEQCTAPLPAKQAL